MTKVERITAAIRREYPYAAAHGTYTTLFQRHTKGTDILETSSGPPVYVEGGVAAGSYSYRPTGDVLSAEEFQAVCTNLNEKATPAPTPPQATDTVEHAAPLTPAEEPAHELTVAERRRNALRARADAVDNGGRRYGR